MAAAWRRGEYPLAEEYLARDPELHGHTEAAIRLIYEEICLRQEVGQELPSQQVLNRFPEWQDELKVLLQCHRLLETPPADPIFPEVGEVLGDFRLLAELGRGALGRVFLASQPSLADRPVVLKLTPRDGLEHLSLARVQHTHIVPLYAAQDFPAQNLRVLCMPYFGGVSLTQLLEALRQEPPANRTGRHLLRVLEQAQSKSPIVVPAEGPARQLLAKASYVQAVCWIGACLADALHYAHERGLIHLDLKPGNVLLAADGQPMLLDFHLAREPICPGSPRPEWLGGTPVYMSPEQHSAMAAVREGRTIPTAVDGRSDVYSLGVVLYETLGGKVPLAAEAASLTFHRHNSQLTVGLVDVLRKCLAQDPRDRYRNAAALAEDLRRHLADMPLRGVANRSLVERWRKWRRRQPYALGLASLALAFLLVVSATGAVIRTHRSQQLRQAETALADGQEHLKDQNYSRAEIALRQGLTVAENTLGGGNLARMLEGRLRLARRAQAAEILHATADRIRYLFDPDFLSARELRALEACCHAVWDARALITDRSASLLGPEVERRIQADLFELAILWTDLRMRLAGEEGIATARHEALEVLAEAEKLLGPSPILHREQQVHAAALGLADPIFAAARSEEESAPRTPWEHYILGRSFLRSGNFELAIQALEEAVNLEPQNFWPNFCLGTCAYRLRCYEDAVAAFTACIALAPRSAPCYYNRALAQGALGRPDRALRDYDRAIQHDPGLAAAFLNRGILHYREHRDQAAIDDLHRALDCGADPATIHYNLSLIYLTRQDQAATLACLQRALEYNPRHRDARELQDRLRHRR